MTLFAVCAVVGFVVVLAGLLLDGVLDAIDLDLGPDWLSLPVIGAGVGAFGVAGAAVLSETGSEVAAHAVGAVIGAAFFAGTAALTVLLMRARTDGTPTAASVVGAHGRVITPIAPGLVGEVLLTVAGQTRKFTATSSEELDSGAGVVAVESTSDTAVLVMSTETFWGEPTPDEGRNPK